MRASNLDAPASTLQPLKWEARADVRDFGKQCLQKLCGCISAPVNSSARAT